MNIYLSSPEVRAYLEQIIHQSPDELVLKKSPFDNVTSKELAQQLAGLQKARVKLPLWYKTEGILFPPTLNLEQTSSSLAAIYKSSLVSGERLIDISGGLGIDTYYFSKQVKEVIHVEINPSLQHLAQHNFKQLQADNITSVQGNGEEVLKQHQDLDWLYVDPSRRHEVKGKVFFLEDCEPCIPTIQKDCFKITSRILVKTAPILDITSGLRSLQNVKEIHVVAINNEVKELLWYLEKDYEAPHNLIAVNIHKGTEQTVRLSSIEAQQATPTFRQVGKYLYEPNASVLKLGIFNWLSSFYHLKKLHTHSHLYTSDTLVEFPGKCFKIVQVKPFSKKNMKPYVGFAASIVSRNFKITANDLRKRFKIKESISTYLFFTTDITSQGIIIEAILMS